MSSSSTVERLVGVYDADGTAVGEVSYFLRALIGRAHCALCDVTHGRIRERADWREWRDQLPVPFATYHRDDQPDSIRAASRGRLPVVLAELRDGSSAVLLGPEDLERCGGSPRHLVEAIDDARTTAGLRWVRP